MKQKLKKYQDGGYVKPEEVYNYLISKGLSHEHAVGMLNNIRHESNFNIGVQEKGGTQQGVGLFQYSYPTRKESFLKAVPDYKTNWKGQIDFALTEDITKRYLNEKFDDSAAASHWFTREWENPLGGKDEADRRISTVKQYDKYKVTKKEPHDAIPLNINSAIPSDNTKTKLAPLSPLMLDKKKMAAGGTILPTVLSTAASFIPGIGPAIAPLVGAIANQAMNPVQPEVKQKEDRTMMNPYGLKYGGAAPKNLRALHGGRLDKIAGDIYLAKGKPHSKGGIKGDTDSDGKPEIEFEGGELFLDKDGYMISKPVAKKYKSALERLGKASDSASKSTLARLKRVMIADNEQYRQANDPSLKMKKGGKVPKYQWAGPVNEIGKPQGLNTFDPLWTGSPSALSLNTAMPTLALTNTKAPIGLTGTNAAKSALAGSGYKTPGLGIDPFAKDKPSGFGAGFIADPKLNTFKMDNMLWPGKYSTPISEKLTGTPVPSDVNEGTYNKLEGPISPVGNKFLVAGHLPGLAYNAFMAMQPAEVQKPVYNPYERDITSNLSKMRINPREIENQFTTAMGAGMRTIGNMSTSQGNRLANTVGLYGNISKAKAAQRLASQQAQISIDQYKNQTLQNLGAERVAAKQFADAQTNANKVAKQQFAKTAFEGAGDLVTQLGVNSNQDLTNDMLFKTMQNTFDYKFNEEEYYNMLKGIKPAGMPESEWIIFKRFAANNGLITQGR